MVCIHPRNSELVHFPVLILHTDYHWLVVNQLGDVLGPDVLKLAEDEAGGDFRTEQGTSGDDIFEIWTQRI